MGPALTDGGQAPVPALMVQGTGSDVGKSLLVAGLCRAYANRGLAVRPFKPQNMSNNAAVTPAEAATGGATGEIGRAQALQARAARVTPSVHMNPVLLKPQTDLGAQVVVQGKVEGNAQARDYHALKKTLLPRVLDSFHHIGRGADLVLVEGAGSPAEVNLRAADIANMGFAEAADLPVVLVGDIDRGGVIASLVGTHALVTEAERARIKGYVINKFRGDASLFEDAVGIIAERTGMACFGIVPFFPPARALPREDAMALDNAEAAADGDGALITVAVPRLPRIANFDDLDPLMAEPGVRVVVVPEGEPLPAGADVVLLPGSKATLADLAALRETGWDVDILAHARRGGQVVGLCGGYQMLGRRVADPQGIEGPPGGAPGLGLLDVETVLTGDKTLELARGADCHDRLPVEGYEMHVGLTEGPDRRRPWLTLEDGRAEGAVSPDGRVRGSYLHGLFAADAFRRAFLDRIRSGATAGAAFEARVEETLDALAAHLEAHLDLDALLALSRR
ncbi:MAG: cobyric acid synthase [Hyphomicrobiales bacterium]|nr:cobyric acid synthase [Hyphomicrobiales bacterium]MCP5370100.1 cobyric acid synthase [Hyphomicrobiales bacterium]